MCFSRYLLIAPPSLTRRGLFFYLTPSDGRTDLRTAFSPYRGIYTSVIHIIHSYLMTVTSPLAVLSKLTRTGMSYWTFCNDSGAYTASSSDGKVITCDSVEELRSVYSKFIGWGFRKSSPLKRSPASPVSYLTACNRNAPLRVTEEECERVAALYAD